MAKATRKEALAAVVAPQLAQKVEVARQCGGRALGQPVKLGGAMECGQGDGVDGPEVSVDGEDVSDASDASDTVEVLLCLRRRRGLRLGLRTTLFAESAFSLSAVG